jgi:hypothetical protein
LWRLWKHSPLCRSPSMLQVWCFNFNPFWKLRIMKTIKYLPNVTRADPPVPKHGHQDLRGHFRSELHDDPNSGHFLQQ